MCSSIMCDVSVFKRKSFYAVYSCLCYFFLQEIKGQKNLTVKEDINDTQLDTQELKYSLDLSEDDTGSSTSSDRESIPDIGSLKPYDFEPTIEYNSSSSDDETSQKEDLRMGNIYWCMCGKCQVMETETESLCCLDTNEVPDSYFEGNQYCISKQMFNIRYKKVMI